jgi:lipopolysaccharide transport system ATP-binding protein
MPKDAVAVEHLSKNYLIGHRHSSDRSFKYTALRDVVGQEVRNFARKARDFARGRQIVQGDDIEEFLALDDVSFSVKQGEVLGIVGRNGAGKSTLLKILSRITEPTKGRVTLRGRVSSLLEVGTGFHPELTGRENIFLNGAVLGMTRQEIRNKFDEIVAFAEVEKFLDTPVKHYSSGMYVRLAFAVAAHLEPEILIVDEVLAVGDSEFQRKCLGKMNEVSRSHGRTVLFVSHNMDAVLKLCTRAVHLEGGRVRDIGDARDIVPSYLNSQPTSPRIVDLVAGREKIALNAKARLISASPASTNDSWSIPFGTQPSLDITIGVSPPVDQIELAVAVLTSSGLELATWTNYCNKTKLNVQEGPNTFRVSFEHLRIRPGQYYFGIALGAGRGFEVWIPDAVSFEVTSSEEGASINADITNGAILAFATVLPLIDPKV